MTTTTNRRVVSASSGDEDVLVNGVEGNSGKLCSEFSARTHIHFKDVVKL